MYLVQVDDWLPEVILLLVEVPHTNFTKVSRVVLSTMLALNYRHRDSSFPGFLRVIKPNLVHVGAVVVLTTSKTTTTGMLAVLSDTSLTGGNVAAAEKQVSPSQVPSICRIASSEFSS